MAKSTPQKTTPIKATETSGANFRSLFAAHPPIKQGVEELLKLCKDENVSSDRIPGEIAVALRAFGRQQKEPSSRELCYQLSSDPAEVLRMIDSFQVGAQKPKTNQSGEKQ